jgi:3D (Asp-Asp-Asp) domain-containing protein
LIAAIIATAGLATAGNAAGVIIQVDGRTIPLPDPSATVREALAVAQIAVRPDDQISPALDTPISGGETIRVQRVRFREELREERIPFKTIVQPPSPGVRPYHPTVTGEGNPGLKMVVYRAKLVDGREVERKLVREELVRSPVHRVVVSRSPARLASRSSVVPGRSLEMTATAYDPGPGSCGKFADGRTCNGRRAGYGIVAVDPRVIPLGAKLHISGYGYGIAGDVGGAIKGNRIDLGFNSRAGSLRWGRRRVRVTILE